MRREAQAVLLLLLGGTILKVVLTGSYLRYVRAGLAPYLVAAGVVLVVVAVVPLRRALWPGRRRGPAAVSGDGHAHGNRIGWLLLVPALALLLVAPPAIGSYAADRSGTALPSPSTSDYPALPAGDPVPVSVLDYADRAVFGHGRSLAGRRLRLTGFVSAGVHGEIYLTRMVISCCAADARPVKVRLAGAVPAGLRADGWVQVVGRYRGRADRDPVNGEQIPYLSVLSCRSIAVPKRQYES